MNVELDLNETKETVFTRCSLLKFVWYGYTIYGWFIQRFGDQFEIEVLSDSSNSSKKYDIVQLNKCYFKEVA